MSRIAHILKFQGSSRFIHEELPVTGRGAIDVAQFIQSQGVDANVYPLAFEKQNGDVFGFQRGHAIADVHANSVEKVVAVRFDDQLAFGIGDPAKEASERRLGARMKMNFRLLKQENRRSVIPQKLRYHGQNLADPITYVDQVSLRPLEFPPQIF